MTTVEIKLANLKEWVAEAAANVSQAFTRAECDAAVSEYNRAIAAKDEHCREFNLDPYAPKS